MDRAPLSAFFLSVILISLASPLQSQISFSQPPTFSGNGNIFVADFNNDGKPDLLAANGTMNLGNGDGTFKVGTSVSVPSGASILAVGDFNGDGRPDLLEQGTGTLLVLLGNGDGTFQSPTSTNSGAHLTTVEAADLNGDGKADVVGILNSSLFVYISNGDGTFKQGVQYSTGFASSGSLALLSLGDFNGDSKTDVAVSAGGGSVAGEEIVFLGNGDGTLQATPRTSTGFSFPSTAVTGDFNGDGKLDLVVVSPGVCTINCTDFIYLLPGNGDGTFQTATVLISTNVSVAGIAVSVAAADLNGDGRLDLIVLQDPAVAQIYLQNSDATFSNADSYIVFLQPSSETNPAIAVAVADLNGDGKPDIAFENNVLLGRGNGSFQGVQLAAVPANVAAVVAGNFEKNGRNDIAGVAGTSLYIFQNDGQGFLSLLHTYTLQQPGVGAVVADFNGDGNLDLVAFGGDPSGNWNYSVLLGNGDGSFQPPVYYPQSISFGAPYGKGIAVADFNNDHKLDLALLATNQDLAILLGNGDGTFQQPAYVFDDGGSSLLMADFNNDGQLDIAVSANGGTGILFGKGDGTFQPFTFPPSLSGFYAAFAADVNNDGKTDLIGAPQLALGNGDGTFTVLPGSLPPVVGGIVDINGDGKLDIMTETGTFKNAEFTGFQLGNGDGTFGSFIQTNNGFIAPSLFTDMNGDGRPDMLFLWSGQGFVSGVGVLLNTTPASFELSAGTTSPSPVTAGTTATSIVTAVANFGFNTSAALSCIGLPAGTTCSFNPPSITNAVGKSVLTLTTTASTASGTYFIQIQGAAGSVTNSTTLPLVVQAPTDFSLGPAAGSPTSQTIIAGQIANFTLSVSSSGGFSGTVTFSCAIAPVVSPAPTCLTPPSEPVSVASQNFAVGVATTAPVTTGSVPHISSLPVTTPFIFACLLLISLCFWARTRKRIPALVVSIVIVTTILWTACGGNGGNGSSSHRTSGTPAGTYTVTITGTSGSLSHNTILQVIVR